MRRDEEGCTRAVDIRTERSRVRLHGHVEQQRCDGRVHGDAGTGPVFGHGAGGHVDVYVEVGQRVEVVSKPRRPGLEQAHRRRHRLFHHVADLPGQRHPAIAGIGGRFNEQHLPADRRVGQGDDDAGQFGAHVDFAEVFGGAQQLADQLVVDPPDLARRFPP